MKKLAGLVVGLTVLVGLRMAVHAFWEDLDTHGHGRGQLTACKSNLKNIGTACEMYSTDNGGNYPRSLAQLTPNYLRTLPTCPAVGEDTYEGSYQSFNKAQAHNYTFFCRGLNHKISGEPADFPQYTCEVGLVSKVKQ